MILNALAAQLKRRSKNDFKGRHFEAMLILQAVSWLDEETQSNGRSSRCDLQEERAHRRYARFARRPPANEPR
jgi:hypothetical protein